MANLALNADGTIVGLPCHILIKYTNGVAVFTGKIKAGHSEVRTLLNVLGLSEGTAKSLSRFAVPSFVLECHGQRNEMYFLAKTEGFALCALKAEKSAFLLMLQTEKLAENDIALFQYTAQAAQFLGIKELFFKFGGAKLSEEVSSKVGLNLPPALPSSFMSADMLLYSRFDFSMGGAFVDGMHSLFGISEMSFIAASCNGGFCAGLSIDEISKGGLSVKNFFCAVGNNGFNISGQLFFNRFSFILECNASLNSFMLSGYMPHGSEIDLGAGWRITELAIGIGYKNGIIISLLGRIFARRLMLFAALSLSAAPSMVTLNFLSAASSDLTLPNIVYSFTTAELIGLDSFDFIRIMGFELCGASHLSSSEFAGDDNAFAEGFNRVMRPSGLELRGSYKIAQFGNEKILTDESRMRNYTICPSGQVKLNPQFYYAPADFGSFAGYEIKKGAFFCGVLQIFNFSVKLFFQTNEDGIMAYLNISPINVGIFQLTQSSFKSAAGVVKPSPGGMVSQFLDPNTKGPELFICMSKSQKCFYLDARLSLWSILHFDAHVVYADKKVSVDAKFQFLSIFEVNFYLRADYSNFNSLNFEFMLIADTSGLKRLIQGAIDKIEGAARDFNNRMGGAINKVNEARNSVNGLWGQISNFDGRIQNCKSRISNAPWYKKWYIAIGAGFEIGAYEIAKAGIYIAIGVAQAALSIAEGILRLAQAVGNVVLTAVQGFLQGIISLFYIERLAFAGVASSSGADLAVKLEFTALGKSYISSSTLSLGGGSDRCKNLLNGMVENSTKDDVNKLNNTARSSNKTYRFASLEGNRELYAEGSDYCKRTKAYLRDLQASYAREYGCVMAEGEEILMNVDMAVASAGASAELVMEITDNLNFTSAFNEIEKKLCTEPESRLSLSRAKSLNSIKEQWEQMCELKNALRNDSRKMSKQTSDGVFNTAYAKSKDILTNGRVKDMKEIFLINPDKMLSRAESLMYQKFKGSRSMNTFCPYCEPSLLLAIDSCKANPQQDEKLVRKRATYRKSNYRTRL